jgi:methyltransferase
MSATVAILALVTLQRLVELMISRRNTRVLLAQGAYEAAPDHYPLIVALHALWLAALWLQVPGRAILWPLIGIFAILQFGRIWVLATLGRRWTTRIIVLPGAPLVSSGPYRFMRHPNYMIVIAEIAILPLAFGLWGTALAFSVANAAILAIRIRAEARALASSVQNRRA